MAVFDVFDPLKDVILQFTEEQIADLTEWFDQTAKPLLSINEGPLINAVTIGEFMDFLKLKKLHRRSFHYPHYGEVMKEADLLQAGTSRILTKEQFLYILNKWVIKPEIKHELKLAFQVFDTEKRDYLEIEDIKIIVTMYADKFNLAETIEIARDANLRGDCNVFYADFVETLFAIAPELYDLPAYYLYVNPDEDPSVPPEPEPEPPPKEAKLESST